MGFLKNDKGMTLGQVSMSLMISTLLSITIVSIFTTLEFSSRGSLTTVEVQREMDTALRRMQSDLYRTCINRVVLYPAGAQGAQQRRGMVFPIADEGVAGNLELCPDGNLIGNKTVAYHIYEEENEDGETVSSIRRSVKDGYSHSTHPDDWERLVKDLVEEGEKDGFDTQTIFYDFKTFNVFLHGNVFDLYSDEMQSRLIHFGQAYLQPEGKFDTATEDLVIRFFGEGKNPNSEGYSIGIDALFIGPSNYPREFEYYKEAGKIELLNEEKPLTKRPNPDEHPDDADNNVLWSNDFWIDFTPNPLHTPRWMQISDKWDLIRESAFIHPRRLGFGAMGNMVVTGDSNHLQLSVPDFAFSDHGGDNIGTRVWTIYNQPSSSDEPEREKLPIPANSSKYGEPDSDEPFIVRNQILAEAMVFPDGVDQNKPNFIRVGFSAGDSDVEIMAAYITRKSTTKHGLRNVDPRPLAPGTDPIDYHRHQQLYFRCAATGEVSERSIIPARPSGEADGDDGVDEQVLYSEWTPFPLSKEFDGASEDYFVTLVIDSGHNCDTLKFPDKGGILQNNVNSYFIYKHNRDSWKAVGGDPKWYDEDVFHHWTDNLFGGSGSHYVVSIDLASIDGDFVSRVYDTRSESIRPYASLDWDQTLSADLPAGQSGGDDHLKFMETGLKIRVLNEDRTPLRTWEDSPMNTKWPDNERLAVELDGPFLQFKVYSSASPFFRSEEGTRKWSYDDYVSRNTLGNNPHRFGHADEILMPDAYFHKIDNVEMLWRPQGGRYVNISGIVAMHDEAGKMSVSVLEPADASTATERGQVLKRNIKIRLKKTTEIAGKETDHERELLMTPMNNNRFTLRAYPNWDNERVEE